MRFAPLALLLAVNVAFAQPPEKKEEPAKKEANWKGRKIMSKLGTLRLKVLKVDDEGMSVYVDNVGLQMTYTVREDQGNVLLLRTNRGLDALADKDAVVLLEDAVDYFTKAMEADPDTAKFYCQFRAAAHMMNRKHDAALSDIDEAIRLNPELPELIHFRAVIHADRNDFDKALADLETALSKKPGTRGMLYTRGIVRNKKADYSGAVEDYDQILKGNANDIEALNNLSWLLATCPEGKIRDGQRAVTLGEKAVELTERKNATYLDTLAAAYAEVGRFDDAVRVQQEALADRDFLLQVGNAGSERLELFRSRKAYRVK